MTDVDGVSSRHSNFNRNRNIFPPRLVFSFRFVLPYFLLFSQGREKKRERERERERGLARVGASSCKNKI